MGVIDAAPSTNNSPLPFWRSNEFLSFLFHRLRRWPSKSQFTVTIARLRFSRLFPSLKVVGLDDSVCGKFSWNLTWRQKFSEIDYVVINANNDTVTVIGDVEPVSVAALLRKFPRPAKIDKKEKKDENKEPKEQKDLVSGCNYCREENIVNNEASNCAIMWTGEERPIFRVNCHHAIALFL